MENLAISTAIVVVGYNRPNSLKRLLNCLNLGVYRDVNIPLLISIDYQDSQAHQEVLDIAYSFIWRYGEKEVVQHEKNLGLKDHILSCGNLTSRFDSIILLEDDIYVSPYFFEYSKAMLNRYDEDSSIAGISLYKHLWNVNVSRPFYPQEDNHDVFFMQFAQSWGQCWSRRMWIDFYEWYLENKSFDFSLATIPLFVRSWSSKSWLKFFIAYLVEKNKYFVYPYKSLSTNFGDAGTHVFKNNSKSQVPLMLFSLPYSALPDLALGIKYDVFFERIMDLSHIIGVSENEICIDLYGSKESFGGKKYLLTSVARPFIVKQSFALDLRPFELNVLLNQKGNDIFLYDTTQAARSPQVNPITFILYDIRHLGLKKLLKLLRSEIFNYFK
ncbi:hypothetical protein J2X69_000100 [Algoriphagus sp. 4150]|uniref:hypothetical protein n=1 Tax=Algoriphagus sp. 4150 TaxID=2817756 RepID=UPI0028600600|nr:hypothetical protein [Algoriphagus sp. 4150]MDR7127772.1 hypothetical protein [Algoriphagus sp. 4150]